MHGGRFKSLDRRDFLRRASTLPLALLAGSAPLTLLASPAIAAEERLADPRKLRPGEFVWQPERSPKGPVVVIVSIPDQRVTVYRNGKRIAVSTCSTGKRGHSTPTGTFVILEKDVVHHSNLYNNAPMPYMQRLTWGGVALHAGQLPGYPASHGCVRLPKEFSRLLYSVTHLGTAVIIADRNSAPADVLHPGLVISERAEQMAKEAVARAKQKTTPAAVKTAEAQAVSVIVHTADKRMRVLVNGKVAFEDSVTIQRPELPFGTHAFNLTGSSDDPARMRWMTVDLARHAGANVAPADAAQASALLYAFTFKRIDMPAATAQRLAGLLHPGATILVTDRPDNPAHRTGPGFTIMAEDDA